MDPPRLPIALVIVFLLVACVGVAAATWSSLGGGAFGDRRTGTPSGSASMPGGYVCPPTGRVPPGGGVCEQAFSEADEFLVEPDLAVDPNDQRTMAIVANDGQSAGAASPLLTGSAETRQQRLAVYVSKDGGAAWTRADLPPAPPAPVPLDGVLVPDTQLWDPTIAFDGSGTLHVGGVLIWAGIDGSSKVKRVFHVATDDLGATWTEYRLFGAKVDRPWMAIEASGAIDLVWWETKGTTLGFARSRDGGATWSGLAADAAPVPCYFPAPPIEPVRPHGKEGKVLTGPGSGILVACVRDERFGTPETPPRGVYRYDERTNAFQLLGPLDAMAIPFLHALPDGSLLLVAGKWNQSDILLRRSVDGGTTWTPLPDLAARLSIASDWTFLQSMGSRLDPWGNVELFVRGVDIPPRPDLGPAGPYLDLPMFLGAAYADEFAVAHVVLDPATGAVRSEELLTPAVSHEPTGSPSLGAGRAGDYYGIGFADGHAVLVWEYQRSLHMTFWSP